MPEIKHNFIKGRMNKDLDERLVPNGEYRHAMNIQVSASDGDAVGAVQNVLGNTLGCIARADFMGIPAGSTTIGSVADEKNDTLYWFLASQSFSSLDVGFAQLMTSLGDSLSDAILGLYDSSDPANLLYSSDTFSFRDMIMRKRGSYCEPILVDTFGFIALTPSSIGTGNLSWIANIPSEIYSLVEPGWNITGVNSDGTNGITANVINTLDAAFLNADIGYDPGYQGYGGAFNDHAVQLGLELTRWGNNGMPRDFVLNGNVFLTNNNCSNTINGTPPVGAIIDINGVTQPGTTAISKTVVSLVTMQGAGLEMSMYTLSLPFEPAFVAAWVSPVSYPPHYNENWVMQYQNLTSTDALSGVDNNGALLTGTTQFASVVPNGVINGDLIFGDIAFDVFDLLSGGETIAPSIYYPDIGNGTGGVLSISSYNPDPYAIGVGGSITAQILDASGALLFPLDSWGGDIFISLGTADSNVGTVILDEPFDYYDYNNSQPYEALVFDTGTDRVLGFSKDKKITAINIVDDMLFWTDGRSEPKKINVNRSKDGTDTSGNKHTRLVNKAMNYGLDLPYVDVPIREKHITVIKKGPTTQLSIDVKTGRDEGSHHSGIVYTSVIINGTNASSIIGSTNDATISDFSAVEIGEKIRLKIETGYDHEQDFELEWNIGDEIVLEEFNEPMAGKPNVPITNYTIKGFISEWDDTSFEADTQDPYYQPTAEANNWASSQAGTAHIMLEVVSIQGTPKEPTLIDESQYFVIDRFDNEEKLFEVKFPRFSCRYKYEDGEYSTLAPFTQVVFRPGAFDYHAKKGYNLGMVNTIKSITLGNFIPDDIPKDVVEVDILYKEDSSPNIYIIDTLAPNDEPTVKISGGRFTNWELDEYEIGNEVIRGAIASSQLVRMWDNVPNSALAQEVTGNRIVYGNYTQNIDLKVDELNYKPQFRQNISSWNASGQENSNIKSIKSLREYQMGVVFTDRYGRETPVISNSSGLIKLDKEYSATNNRLQVRLKDNAPDDAEFYKFYIKENSGEYYNLAMDRWYDAEDGNIWLAFPSTERNKITEDTFLILKKGQSDSASQSALKYNVVAIENEAPDFIKITKLGLGKRKHAPVEGDDPADPDTKRVFGENGNELLGIPRVGAVNFDINYRSGNFSNSTLSHLDEVTDGVLYFRFEKGTDYSARYRVSELTSDRNTDLDGNNSGMHVPYWYHVTLDKQLDTNINFIFDNPDSPSKIVDGVRITFWKYKSENKPQFDGRFFVKIHNDGSIKKTITDTNVSVDYNTIATRTIYLLEDDKMITTHRSCAVTNEGVNVLDPFYAPDQAHGDRRTWEHMSARASFFSKLKSGQHGTDGGIPYHGFYDMLLGDVDDENWCDTQPCNAYKEGKAWTPVNNLETDFKNVWFINKQKARGHQHSESLYAPFAKNRFDADNEYAGSWRYISTPDGRNREQPDGTATLPGMGRQFTGIHHKSETTQVQLGFGGIEAPGGSGSTGLGLSMGIGGTHHTSIGQIISTYTDAASANSDIDITDFSSWAITAGTGAVPINAYGIGDGYPNQMSIPGHFDIASDAGNSNYDSERQFASKIDSGSMFQWDGDPYKTTYSLAYGIDKERQLHRFHEGDSGHMTYHGMSRQDALFMGSPANYTKAWDFDVSPKMDAWNPTANYGSHIVNGLSLGVKNYTSDDALFDTIGDNFITLSVANTDIRPGMTINGAGIPDNTTVTAVGTLLTLINLSNAITAVNNVDVSFGFVCEVVEDLNSTGSGNTEGYHVEVSSNVLECSIHGGKHILKKGMLLKAYNVDFEDDSPNSSHTFPSTFNFDALDVNSSSNLLIKKIQPKVTNGVTTHLIKFTGFTQDFNNFIVNVDGDDQSDFNDGTIVPVGFIAGRKLWFRQASMNSVSNWSEENGDNSRNNLPTINGGIGAVGYDLKFVEAIETYEDGGFLPEDPFVWETEQADPEVDLDIYYEASGRNPIELNADNLSTVFPVNSIIRSTITSFTARVKGNISADGDEVLVNRGSMSSLYNNDYIGVSPKDKLEVTRPDGSIISVIVSPDWVFDADNKYAIKLKRDLFNNSHQLNWFNCYSFGNGVESNRVRDSFNLPFIQNGVRVSSTTDEPYKKENRKSGLIYSGIYNSTSGVNQLNQFSMAEKITKDLNPIYGSIQKLHSRSTADGDLIALCEDRIVKILANKDALYNADGNPQLTATNRVLGQATPFSGEYGISKNPESFASYSYRAYFSDKVRGAVLRLSKDGLTVISNNGMKDWFRDNLKLSNAIIGSHDDKNEEYNITLDTTVKERESTVTFKENVKGWSSFKSFVPENGISCASSYYTFEQGKLWLHDHEALLASGASYMRNTFYNKHWNSSFKVLFNNAPSIVKSFKTINYEGSQAKVDQNFSDGQYYNLSQKKGWYVESIVTNKERGGINEFIEKEGKWFNYIKGENVKYSDSSQIIVEDGRSTFDHGSFAIQGLGVLNSAPNQVTVSGCTDPTAWNYDSDALVEDGSCIPVVLGCMLTSSVAFNSIIDPPANTDDGSCYWVGCDDSTMFNYSGPYPPETYTYYNSNIGTPAILPVPGCVPVISGCTEATATNYDAAANTDDGSCQSIIFGCMLPFADNYDTANPPNNENGTCVFYGCWYPSDIYYGTTLTAANLTIAENYVAWGGSQYGLQDDGALCVSGGCTFGPNLNTYEWNDYIVDGPNDQLNWGSVYVPGTYIAMGTYSSSMPQNYDAAALWDDGSCIFLDGCTDPLADNYYAQAAVDDGTCVFAGCMNASAVNFDCQTSIHPNSQAPCNDGVNADDGSCDWLGCIDPLACNYNPSATIDDSTCDYVLCAGCMEGMAYNYNIQTNSTTPCMDPSDNAPAPCTIPCGDGTDSSPQGPGCCTSTHLGCMDNNFCNYDPNANTDNGLCSNDGCTGCMDSDWTLYNTNINTGLPQVNTRDCNGDLGGTDVSCCGSNYINGCMDPSACNYDVMANTDPYDDNYLNGSPSGGQTSCVYAVNQVTTEGVWGGTPRSLTLVDDINFSADDLGTNRGFAMFFNPSGAGNNGNWPFGTPGTNDTGMGQYAYDTSWGPGYPSHNENNSIKLLVEEKDLFTGIWSDVSLYYDSRAATQDNMQTQLQYGQPFLNSISVYAQGPNGIVPAQYRYTIYSRLWKSQYINSSSGASVAVLPTEYGTYNFGGSPMNSTHYSPNCGVSSNFSFNVVPCDASNSVMGCTDNTACNYNANANCNDGNCIIQTLDYYVNFNPGVSFCEACDNGGCSTTLPDCPQYNPDGTTAVVYTNEAVCNGAQGPA